MELDNINEFINNMVPKISLKNITNLKILICRKDSVNNQKILYITEIKDDLLSDVYIIDIKNHRKKNIHSYNYSFYGGIKETLYFIIRDVLSKETEFNEKNEFLLNYTFIKEIPTIENSELIVIDKTDIIEKHNNNSCVVCYEKYNKEKVEFKLRCNHSICRECFYNIIIHNSLKCPLCRQIMV